MKKSIFRWSAAVLAAASLGLALGGCGAKDKKTASSSAKTSTSKVEKKAKSNRKKSATSSSQANDTVSSSTQATVPAEFDYIKYNDFRFSLTKEQ